MALVRSDVCGCLGAWKCSANPLVGLLGRINWLAVIKVIGFNGGFSFTCYEEGWFNHSCAKRLLGGNQPRCEALQLPLFLCSSIREEHFCRTSAGRCAALFLWQWPHLQLVTWMIQRILGAPISATYAVGYLGFFIRFDQPGHQVDYTNLRWCRISLINYKYQLYLSVGTRFHFWFVIGNASLKRNDGPND